MTDWNLIIQEYGTLVWRTACRLLTHEADAEDCFQRTFMAAVELDAREPIQHWAGVLKRIVTARALEQLRARYRSGSRVVDLHGEPLTDRFAPEPHLVAESDELAAALEIALTEIAPLQAEAFCLVVFEELSYADVAKVLGVNANHAGVLLARARASIRDKLSKFHPGRERVTGGRQ